MSSKSKVKGYRVEKKLELMHNTEGVPAERVPLSGMLGGKYKGDLCIPSIEHCEFRCESKSRAGGKGFIMLDKWLSDNDILFVKRNNSTPLAVMPWEVYLKIMKSYYKKDNDGSPPV
jgi:hypothetical protein